MEVGWILLFCLFDRIIIFFKKVIYKASYQ
jgi:hypothetical protein